MRLRVVVLMAAAGVAALGGVTVARNWLDAQRATIESRLAEIRQPEPIQTVPVLVAAHDVPGGSFIKAEHLDWADFPEDAVLDTYLTRDAENPAAQTDALDGAVIRHGLVAGEPIVEGRLVRPGERGFLAAVLKPGLRAVSVPINATTGISGFIFPGDRVDLLLTHKIPGDEVRLASETVLRDLRVLAVDQRTDDQDDAPAVGRTVTLEVDADQSEVIAVAMQMGTLSLALRSLAMPEAETAEGPPPEGRGYTWDSQASRLIPVKPREPAYQVRIVRAGEAMVLSFPEVPK